MKKQITITDLQKYVKEGARKLMEADGMTSLGDPLDVKMNSMLDDGGKLGKPASGQDPMNVSMNTNDKVNTSQGKDGAITMVSDKKVEAKTSGPATSTGEPFDEKVKVDLNKMDDEGDDTVKTFVKTGGEMGSSQESNTGMKKAEFKETPENEKEKEKKIADAIQIKEAMTFSNQKALLEWCAKEAEKVSKLL